MKAEFFSGLKIILKNHIKFNLPLKMQVYFFVNIPPPKKKKKKYYIDQNYILEAYSSVA